MPNKHRGEIEAEIGGARRKLVLTLGALAELEAAFGADDLVALAERFGAGRLKARDLVRVIGAGLRGAGEAVSDDAVAAMTARDGAAGFVRIAIAKPVPGSVRVAVAGAEKTQGVDFACDPTTGVVTFLAQPAPGAGAAVTAGFLFDVPVRFDTDYLEVDLTAFAAGAIPKIPLIEIRP